MAQTLNVFTQYDLQYTCNTRIVISRLYPEITVVKEKGSRQGNLLSLVI